MFRKRNKELDCLGPIESRWYPTTRNYSGISFHNGVGVLPEWLLVLGGTIVFILAAILITAMT